jgi:transposase InsO family protein
VANFTDLKLIGRGWFYLWTILDDYSRDIIAWKLYNSMKVDDVTDTTRSIHSTSRLRLRQGQGRHRPRLLCNNGPCYFPSDLGEWPAKYKMDQIRGHPQTRDKVERWRQTLKNHILSRITITADTTRVSAISPRPASTSDTARPYCSNAKGSNDTQSDNAA